MNKFDTIINVLEKVGLLFESHGQYPHTLREVNEALTAAKELQALKPVGFFKQKGAVWNQYDEDHPAYTALYRLD